MVKSYKNFGLTIIKHSGWHITFRHPTYSPHQPTGHFHQDWLSITVSIDGIAIFVDPGTYVYTSDIAQRNALRSMQSHNTFWTTSQTNLAHPFVLPRTPHTFTGIIAQTDDTFSVYDYHNEFAALGLQAHRSLTFNTQKQTLTITDWWTGNNQKIHTYWAFHQKDICALLTSSTQLTTQASIYCPTYGKKETIHQHTASAWLAPEEKITHTLQRA